MDIFRKDRTFFYNIIRISFIYIPNGASVLYDTGIWQHIILGGILASLHGCYSKVTSFFCVVSVV
jgi:hypothetical protein